MNGFLLKNPEGVLGLAVVDETRKLERVVYLSGEKNLQIFFSSGKSEMLVTEIDCEFEVALFKMKKIFVGHFPHDGFGKEPTDEYFVPLDL